MIAELRIRGLGVIDAAVIPFAAGLTVLTGETGAGKTMVLTGLALVSGERPDPGLVRAGVDRADIDAQWRLSAPTLAAVAERLADAGVAVEQDEGAATDATDAQLLVGRTVAAGGRSRAFAGGRTVPASVLADLATDLLVVHGQADQLALRDPRRQRTMLDAFARATDTVAQFAAAYGRWRALTAQVHDLVEHRAERERAAQLLRLGVGQIAAVAPAPGEDVELKELAARLARAADVLADLDLVAAALGGDESTQGAGALIEKARRQLADAGRADPDLGQLAADLGRLAADLADLADRIGEHAAAVDVDPHRLAQVEQRRHEIGELKRRYGPELDDVLAWWQESEAKIARADETEDSIEALRAQCAAEQDSLVALGRELTRRRREAAQLMGAAVTAELRELAMPQAEVTVEVTSSKQPDSWTAEGADQVEFRLVPHAGAAARPLDRGASGGELSRLMLAIEVVLAGKTSVPTFVFDEVDAGIGGKVAVEVGRRLARLARSAQVVVVTHLPQVAAFADRHVVVAKGSDGQVTAASVQVVEGQDRVRELVRMLSGLEDSQSGAEHAAELLAVAAADREPPPATRRRARSAR